MPGLAPGTEERVRRNKVKEERGACPFPRECSSHPRSSHPRKQGQALGISLGPEVAVFLIHQQGCCPALTPHTQPVFPLGIRRQLQYNLDQDPIPQTLPLLSLPLLQAAIPTPTRLPTWVSSQSARSTCSLSCPCPYFVLGLGHNDDSESALPSSPPKFGQIVLFPLTSRLMLFSQGDLLEFGKCCPF